MSMDDIHPGLVLTFSAGVSECASQDDIELAIERADRAMYEAKSAGRDRAIAVGDAACDIAPVPPRATLAA